MKWIKMYGWQQELKYYLYFLPKEIIRALVGIARKDHVLNEMDWREYLDCACGVADMKAGRFYMIEEGEQHK